MSIASDLLPGEDLPPVEHVKLIMSVWQALWRADIPDPTTREDLDYLYFRVDACLGQSPPDLGLASGLTAKAFLMLTGVPVI